MFLNSEYFTSKQNGIDLLSLSIYNKMTAKVLSALRSFVLCSTLWSLYQTSVPIAAAASLPSSSAGVQGPSQHLLLATASYGPRELFCAKLLDRLWDLYRQRLPYVEIFESLQQHPIGRVVQDHVAFRTFASVVGGHSTGIPTLSRIWEALGYRVEGVYAFPTQGLSALHLEHTTHPTVFPKLFLSELRIWELPDEARAIVEEHLDTHYSCNELASNDVLSRLLKFDLSHDEQDRLLEQCFLFFETLPWKAPTKEAMHLLNQHSQYAAWVLVHGYKVNHFAALVDSVEEVLASLEKTAFVPMKASIEGAPMSKLRQTATLAVVTDVPIVLEDGTTSTMPWPYAYFEICERNHVLMADGTKQRFEGFLGAQATELFEMTRAML